MNDRLKRCAVSSPARAIAWEGDYRGRAGTKALDQIKLKSKVAYEIANEKKVKLF